MPTALAQGDVERAKARYADHKDIEWIDERPEPGTLDLLVLDHVLQGLFFNQVGTVLDMYAQLLKPGGQLVVIVPSLEWACGEYVRQDDPGIAAFVSLYGTPEEPNRCGFNLLHLRSVIGQHPALDVAQANAEWYVAQVQGKQVRVLQNVVIAAKH